MEHEHYVIVITYTTTCRLEYTMYIVNISCFMQVHSNTYECIDSHSAVHRTINCILVMRIILVHKHFTHTHKGAKPTTTCEPQAHTQAHIWYISLVCACNSTFEMVVNIYSLNGMCKCWTKPRILFCRAHTRWGYVKINIYRDSQIYLYPLYVLLCRQTASKTQTYPIWNSFEKPECRVIEVCTKIFWFLYFHSYFLFLFWFYYYYFFCKT